MNSTEEQNRKTTLERERIRSQIGSPLAPQVARNPEAQEKPGAAEGPQEEAEAQREPRARQQEAAAQKQEATATATGAAEEAAKKIPGVGAAISGIAKTFPILGLIIGWAKKLDVKSIVLQIIVKVLTVVLGVFVWPILVFASFLPFFQLPKTTIWEFVTASFIAIIVPLIIFGTALIFICNFPGPSLCPSV